LLLLLLASECCTTDVPKVPDRLVVTLTMVLLENLGCCDSQCITCMVVRAAAVVQVLGSATQVALAHIVIVHTALLSSSNRHLPVAM
jgi:hypothetical protein